MSFSLIISFISTFFIVYGGTYVTLTSWSVKPPVSIAISAILGAFAAIFATLAIAPLLGV